MKFDDFVMGIVVVVFITIALWMFGAMSYYILLDLPNAPPILYPLAICFFGGVFAFLIVLAKMICDISR